MSEETKRGRGRPPGAKNKVVPEDKDPFLSSMTSITELCPKAVRKLEAILDQKLDNTSVNQVLTAALKVLEISAKQRETGEAVKVVEEVEEENSVPLISLKAVN